jgi:LmbE family N-acetylglucosaminyl deacetylase
VILALAPHTDDVTLGAGGFLSHKRELGECVAIVAFSTGNSETGSSSEEFNDAAGIIGACVADTLGYPTRAFPDHRQAILASIEEQIALYQPNLLLVPARHDHQDHCVVRTEACRVVSSMSISVLAYEHAWSNTLHSFHPRCFAAIPFRHMCAKLNAMKAFRSQSHHPYMDSNYAIANALRWGIYVNDQFAEAFEVVKWTT